MGGDYKVRGASFRQFTFEYSGPTPKAMAENCNSTGPEKRHSYTPKQVDDLKKMEDYAKTSILVFEEER